MRISEISPNRYFCIMAVASRYPTNRRLGKAKSCSDMAATFATDRNSGVTSLIRYHRSSFVHYARPVLRHTTTALHTLPLTQMSRILDSPTLPGSCITYEPDDMIQILYFFNTFSKTIFRRFLLHFSLLFLI